MSIQFPNLGINLGYVGKSIQIFGFEITFFGLVIALGMLLGMGFVILEAKRCGENKDDYLEMMIMSLLLGWSDPEYFMFYVPGIFIRAILLRSLM